VPREKRASLPPEIEEGIAYANRELAKKELTPHNPGGVPPHGLKLLHGLLPYAYLHAAHLPAAELKKITSSQAALKEYVDRVYGRKPHQAPLIAAEAVKADLNILKDEEKGPALLAEVKRRYYQPLYVHKAINEANTILTSLLLRKKMLSAEHRAALAAIPPFSRRFLAKWLAGQEMVSKTWFELSPEERRKTEKISELRLSELQKVVAEGPEALRKLVDGLVLSEQSMYRSKLRPEEREYDQLLLRADRAQWFDAVRKLYRA